jgi:ubiquinone/menaquinone biosynthesis C-methylase UbiE
VSPPDRYEAGMKILDCGCGPGRLSIPLARAVGPTGTVVAFDIQEEMLEKVRRKAKDEQLSNIITMHGGAGDGKLAKNEYDMVLLVTVLGEIPDRQKAMREIFAGLKPNGILSVTEVIADPHFQSLKTVISEAEKAGFIKKAGFGGRLSFTLNFQKPQI